MSFTTYVWASLIRNRTRLSLIGLSLVIAFLLFGLLQPIQQTFSTGPQSDTDARLVVTPRYSMTDMLPERYAEQIGRLPGVAVVSHMTWFGGEYVEAANFFPQYAVTAQALLHAMPELELDRAAREAFLANRRGAIIGQATAMRFNLRVGDPLPLLPTIWHNQDGTAWEFEVSGIFTVAPGSLLQDDAMYFHYAYFDDYRQIARGTVSNFLVTVSDEGDLTEVAAAIDELHANSASATRTMTDQEYALSFARQMGQVGLMVNAVLAAVFFTMLLVSGNSVTQSVRERLAEMAVLNVLGFRLRTVAALVVAEVLALTLIACSVGLILAELVLMHIGGWLPSLASFGQLSVNRHVVMQALLLALAVVVLVVAGPVTKISRLKIVDALRV
ncbi:MAG: ABC transporter permease [Pseudomonadota bacterium]